MTKTTRRRAGVYAVTDGLRTVTVAKTRGASGGTFWRAAPDWDDNGPCWHCATKREAVREARVMLINAKRPGRAS